MGRSGLGSMKEGASFKFPEFAGVMDNNFITVHWLINKQNSFIPIYLNRCFSELSKFGDVFETTLNNELQDNLVEFFDWGLLEKGNYFS